MNPISRTISLLFIAFWLAFVFLDYWQKHPVYFHAFRLFSYGGLALALAAIGAGVGWLLLKKGKSKKTNPLFRGLGLAGLFLLLGVLAAGFAFGQMGAPLKFDAVRAFRVLFLLGGSALALYLIVVSSYAGGTLLERAISWQAKAQDAPVLRVAVGMLGLALSLFLLGALGLLHWFTVLPLMGLVLFFAKKEALAFVKLTLWQPLPPSKDMNWVGAAGLYLLIALYAINFTAANVPMPSGFDAMTLYGNLPVLIAERHALVEGFQPYNWSLLMSLGHLLFDSTAVCLALSWLGGALTAFAMYALCRNWLNMSVNATFPAILVFSLTPSFVIQSSAELKVDLGLLFVLLSTLLLLLNHLSGSPSAAGAAKKKWGLPEPQLVCLGLLSGFALGIKLTTIYFALALVCALWYARCGGRGFFAAFLTGLFLVLFLKLDDIGGLRQYHFGVDTLQWGAFGAGLLLAAGAFLKDAPSGLAALRSTAVYAVFMALPFLPWMAKNYVETKSLSPDMLLNGKQASPEINLQILEQNLQKQ